jgi:hypothetical protein
VGTGSGIGGVNRGKLAKLLNEVGGREAKSRRAWTSFKEEYGPHESYVKSCPSQWVRKSSVGPQRPAPAIWDMRKSKIESTINSSCGGGLRLVIFRGKANEWQIFYFEL